MKRKTPLERWESDLKKKSHNTVRQYNRYFEKFLEEKEITAEEFYDYCKKISDEKDPDAIKTLDDWLNEYFETLLVGPDYKLSTIRIMEASIHSFLKANTIDLPLWFDVPTETKRENLDQIQQTGKIKAEVQEIKKLVDVCGNPRNTAIILTLRDSGMRAGDIGNIKMRDIKPVLEDPDLDYHSWTMLPEKNVGKDRPLNADPVLGPESLEAIRFWVQKRKILYKENGLDPSDPESYLFPSIINREGVTCVGDKIDGNAVNQIFHKLREKAILEKPVSPHSIRKTFETNMLGADVEERWLNKMIGKQGQGTRGVYQTPNREEIIGEYSKGYHSISFKGKPESQAIKELKKTVDSQQQELDQMKDLLFQFFSNRDDVSKELTRDQLEKISLDVMERKARELREAEE